MSDLAQFGAAGAVIICVIVFLKFLTGFFARLNGLTDRIGAMTTALEEHTIADREINRSLRDHSDRLSAAIELNTEAVKHCRRGTSGAS